MTEEDSSEQRGFGSMLRMVLFYAVLIALPLGVYFVFYVEARVEQSNVRNFRALDAASERLKTIIANLHQIAGNVPVGVPSEDFKKMILESTRQADLSREEVARLDTERERLEAEIKKLNGSYRELKQEYSDSRLQKKTRPSLAEQLFQAEQERTGRDSANLRSDMNEVSSTLRRRQIELARIQNRLGMGCQKTQAYEVLETIRSISDEYVRDYDAIASATEFEVRPLLLSDAENGSSTQELTCEERVVDLFDIEMRTFSGICDGSAEGGVRNGETVSRRLVSTEAGVAVEARDCRSFLERSRKLAASLPHGHDAVAGVLDQYGVSVIASLQSLVDNIASNVAPLFDQYLIADDSGRVLYSVNRDRFRYQGVTGAPSTRRARLDFVNHVNLKELIASSAKEKPSELAQSLARLGLEQASQDTDLERYGVHSRVEDFQVADITFQAFVHPFEVEELAPLPDSELEADRASVLYMIGIVSRASLSSESVKLRLSLVTNALLAIGVLFSSLALLWLWTGGDRLMLTFRHLLLFLATGLAATILYTLFAMHLVTHVVDDLAFDKAVEQVSDRIQADFAAEFEKRMGSLAEATAQMLKAGEAKARDPDPHEHVDEEPGGALAAEIGRNYFCRPDPTDAGSVSWPPVDTSTKYPTYDLAFLMDQKGVQWQCLSHRLFDTRPIDLKFRQYFHRPRDGQLWRLNTTSAEPAMPGFFLDRITSILDGTTETVLAARPDAMCDYLTATGKRLVCSSAPDELASVAIIGRLHSLEATILPPHVRFAVVNNDSGLTLFHSVGSRALATNFIRETEADQSLLALVDARVPGFVDLDYYDTSIRAFVQPLADGVPWTLITYRDHELADTLGIVTVSATAAYIIGTLVPLALILLMVAFIYRRALARAWRWREALLSRELVQELRTYLIWLTAIASVLLAATASFFPAFGGLLALITMVAAPVALAVVAWRQFLKWRASTEPGPETNPEQHDRITGERGPVVAVLVMVIMMTTVLPTIGWYLDIRADLGAGLSDYMRSATRDEVTGKCERQTAFARRYKTRSVAAQGTEGDGVFDHGWTLLARVDKDKEAEIDEPACASYSIGLERLASVERALPGSQAQEPRWGSETLRAIGAFSGLGSDLTARNAYTRSDAELVTPSDVLTGLLGPSDQPLQTQRPPLSSISVLVFAGLFGLALAWVVVVSLSDRVLGMRVRLGLLPPAGIDPLPGGWIGENSKGLRACVVHRSEKLWEIFLHRMLDVERQRALRARWTGEEVVWEPVPRGDSSTEQAESIEPDAADASTLYVVSGLEMFIVDAAARDGLLDELEKIAGTADSVLICSRILPGNWLANLTDQVSGDLANVTEQLALTSRWSQVLGPFDVRRLVDRRIDLEKSFRQELEKMGEVAVSSVQHDEVHQTMLREARANPELLEFAASVVRRVSTSKHPARGSLRRIALQRFRAGAASYFHTIWAASSREERLQLLAMAKGGFANPTQTAAIFSLANRGLIATEGVVRLRSDAFAEFVASDLDHDSLLRWRDHGHGNIWKSIWPPIVLVVVLAVAFFVSSTPEVMAPLAAILAASLGAVPVISSLLRGARDLRSAPSDD